jgi:hypothetical protein
VRVTRPLRNLIQRAIATDADTRVRIDRADFYARGFDGLKSHKHFVIIAAFDSVELMFGATALSWQLIVQPINSGSLMFLRLIASALVACVALLPSVASANDFFTVRMEIAEAGQVIAQPKMTLVPKSKAMMTQSGGNKDVVVELELEPLQDNTFRLATKLQSGDRQHTPTFVSVLDQDFSFESGDLKVKFFVTKNKT